MTIHDAWLQHRNLGMTAGGRGGGGGEPVPFLTMYLGGAIAPPPQGNNLPPPPSKAISAPEVRSRIAHDSSAVRIAVDLLDNEIMPFHSHLVCNSYCSSPSIS